VEPSVALKGRILGLTDPLTLEELLGRPAEEGDKLDHLRRVARLKVIGVFRVAGEVSVAVTEQPSGLEYCLSGMDGSHDQLATTIARNMKGSHSFVKPGDLSPTYRDLAEHWRNTVRAYARHLLLSEVVDELAMRQVKLWYHSGERRWQAAQSLIDEHDRLLREVKGWREPRPELPFNRRPWHGRPARDRRRAVMPGTSVGYAA
jgi:hypothetical protein